MAGVMGASLPRARGARMRRLTLFALLAACVVQVTVAGVGERGLLTAWEARRSVGALRADVASLRVQNGAIREACRRLREDPQAIEAIARIELGLIKPGEKVFIIRSERPK